MMSSAISFQKKRLATRLVLTARAACAVRDLDTAFQVLKAAEVLLHDGKMTPRDRHGVIGLIVGTHVQVWELRHPGLAGLPTRRSLREAAAMRGR